MVLDRERVGTVEVHVEAGISKDACFTLFFDLAPDELFDVGVLDIEDCHFGCTAGLPPDLIVPADASAPRMKLTGPEAVPPPSNSSALNESSTG